MFTKLPSSGNPPGEGGDNDEGKTSNESKPSGRVAAPPVEPRTFDVLLGRGKSNQTHPGNQRFQVLVDMYRERYLAASSRQEKVHITQQVVVAIREGGGWFIRYDDSRRGWFQIGEQAARKKVAQAIQYQRRRTAQQDVVGTEDSPQRPPAPTVDATDAASHTHISFSGRESRSRGTAGTAQSLFANDPSIAATLALHQQQLASQNRKHLNLSLTGKSKEGAKESPHNVHEDSKKPPADESMIGNQQFRRQSRSAGETHLLSDDEILSALEQTREQLDNDPDKKSQKEDRHD